MEVLRSHKVLLAATAIGLGSLIIPEHTFAGEEHSSTEQEIDNEILQPQEFDILIYGMTGLTLAGCGMYLWRERQREKREQKHHDKSH